MGWHEFGEMVYYTLLKRGQILIAVMALIIGILVYLNAVKYGVGVSTTTSNAITTCQADSDCFEECGRCISVSLGRNCTQTGIVCSCINSTCTQAT